MFPLVSKGSWLANSASNKLKKNACIILGVNRSRLIEFLHPPPYTPSIISKLFLQINLSYVTESIFSSKPVKIIFVVDILREKYIHSSIKMILSHFILANVTSPLRIWKLTILCFLQNTNLFRRPLNNYFLHLAVRDELLSTFDFLSIHFFARWASQARPEFILN